MKQLIAKIASAKMEIKNSKLKKEGRNEFSKYDYFTPSQIEYLVATACANNGLLTTFDLIRDNLGVFGTLKIYDIETGQNMSTVMATAIPEIKATNIAQQLGGCVTYTERYLKMSFFGITDNKLDFDTSENTKKLDDDVIKDIIFNVETTNSREQLTELWKSIPQLHKNEKIIKIFKDKKYE